LPATQYPKALLAALALARMRRGGESPALLLAG